MNFFGILIGLSTLLIIGLGFVWVIRGERYFGYLWWPYLLGLGLALAAASLFLTNDAASALLGALGASLAWGATELEEQAVRAELGWFPFRAQKILPPGAGRIRKWRGPRL
ncbi:MAG: DUF4491 family protein [Anaerolineales bacterium]|jgi:hypothetical protein|nr:DUF4491 family protein [Anaerolineales bacterium]